VANSSIVTANHCTVENNISDINGAGVRVSNKSTFQLEYSNVRNNSATNSSGGGIYVNESTLIVTKYSDIYKNFAAETGGGIYVEPAGGSVEIDSYSFVYD